MSINTNYDVTVYAQSKIGNLSDGARKRILLRSNPGAGEVSDIDIEFSISTFANVGVETKVKWKYERTNPSLSFAEKFLVTFVDNLAEKE